MFRITGRSAAYFGPLKAGTPRVWVMVAVSPWLSPGTKIISKPLRFMVFRALMIVCGFRNAATWTLRAKTSVLTLLCLV